MSGLEICRTLDHAVLKPGYTRQQALAEMRVGLEHNVRTICVRPCDLEQAVKLCRGTQTDPSVVLAFPHGTHLSASKAEEARRYIELGVKEIDMVANYGFILSDMWDEYLLDVAAVTEVARPDDVLVKVILETTSLDLPRIARATELAVEAGASFVKTSTGFADGGASDQAVRTMLDAAKGRIAVKASGGIRDRQRAEMFLAMGCKRLGVGSTSTPVICGKADGAARGQGY